MDENKNINDNQNNINDNKILSNSVGQKDMPFIKILFWLSTVIFGILSWVVFQIVMILLQFQSGTLGGIAGGLGDSWQFIKSLIVIGVVFVLSLLALIITVWLAYSKAKKENEIQKMKIPGYANAIRLAISGGVLFLVFILSMLGIDLGNLSFFIVIGALIGCYVFSFLTALKNYPVVFNKIENQVTEKTDVNLIEDKSSNQNAVEVINKSLITTENNNIVQKGFLDNIFKKDNPQNKLFLKILFYLSTAATTILIWAAFRGWTVYSGLKNETGKASKGDFGSALNSLGQGLGFLSELKTMHNILKLLIIALIILLIIIYLKLKKENSVSKLKNLNYASAIGLSIFGLLEMNSVGTLIKSLSSFTGMFGAAVGMNTPNPALIKISLAGTFLFALSSAITNYFIVFKNKNIETEDIKSGIDTGIDTVKKMDPEKKKKYAMIAGGIIGIILLYNIGVNYIFAAKVDLSNVYTVKINGASGQAEAFFDNKINSEFDKNNEKINQFLRNEEVNYTLSKTEGISNGDVIEVIVTYDKNLAKSLKVRPKNEKYSFKVEELPEIVKEVSEIKDFKGFLKENEDYLIDGIKEKNKGSDFNIEKLGAYIGKDENGNLSLRIFIKETKNSGFWKNISFDYIEITNITKNDKGMISGKNTEIKNYNGISYNADLSQLDARLNLEGFSKVQ